jgi:hypothetical protein
MVGVTKTFGSNNSAVAEWRPMEGDRGNSPKTKNERNKTMRNQVRRKYNTLLCVKGYMQANPLAVPIAEVTAQMVIVDSSITAIETLGGTQVHGESEALGGTDSRELIAPELRETLREISGIVKRLDASLYPGAKAAFRMTGTGSYIGLLNRARSFTESVGPIKAVFVDRGLPADFDETLAELIDEMAAATERRILGIQERKQGTVGMVLAGITGINAVRVLDSIMSVKLRNDPTMLAVWKAAQHVERDPVRQKSPTPPPALAVAPGLSPEEPAADEAHAGVNGSAVALV